MKHRGKADRRRRHQQLALAAMATVLVGGLLARDPFGLRASEQGTAISGRAPGTAAAGGLTAAPTEDPTVTVENNAPEPAADAPTPSAPLVQVADRIQEYGFSRPDVFTSVQVDAKANRVVVHRKAGTDFDSQISGLSGGATVIRRDSPRSLAELRHLRAEVLAYAETRGVEVAGTELADDGRVVVVRVAGDVATARNLLGEKFGTVVDVDPGEFGALL